MAQPLLSDDEIRDGLTRLDGWTRDGDEIVAEYELASFPEAITFVTRVAELAEAANHHPDIDIRYRKVRLALSTHDRGGLTAKDLALAEQVHQVARAAT